MADMRQPGQPISLATDLRTPLVQATTTAPSRTRIDAHEATKSCSPCSRQQYCSAVSFVASLSSRGPKLACGCLKALRSLWRAAAYYYLPPLPPPPPRRTGWTSTASPTGLRHRMRRNCRLSRTARSWPGRSGLAGKKAGDLPEGPKSWGTCPWTRRANSNPTSIQKRGERVVREWELTCLVASRKRYSNLHYRVHGNRGDGFIVCRIMLYEEMGAHIPHFQCTICTTRRQAVSFCMKYNTVHSTAPNNALEQRYIVYSSTTPNLLSMIMKRMKWLVCWDIPKFHEFIVTSGCS